jgi:hypothetical protein
MDGDYAGFFIFLSLVVERFRFSRYHFLSLAVAERLSVASALAATRSYLGENNFSEITNGQASV